MDPIIILILVVFAVLVGVAILWSRRSPKAESPMDETLTEIFEFTPDEQGAVPTIARRTRIVAPGQRVNNATQKIRVIAQPLPQINNLVIPAEKGIDSLDILLINPVVRLADSDQELNEFDPPLTVTVWLDKQDMTAGKLTADGAPAMSLITGYQAADGWKFERLSTERSFNPETGGGTLSAQIRTLTPKDPVWAGFP